MTTKTKQKLTKKAILSKINRKKNPVTSVTQLAREFGYNTMYERYGDPRGRQHGSAAPRSFRNRVKALVGKQTYNRIRQSQFVNHSYR